MIYILDAYNVIHKTPRLEAALDKDLRSARAALIELCRNWAADRGDITKIILVFDGKSQFRDLPQDTLPQIKSVFSETGESADERIGEVLEELGEKVNRCVIVSDDNSVRNHARAYKAHAMTVSDFNRLIQNTGQKKDISSPSKKNSLSKEDADDITETYRKKLGL